jgi:hypothetical protein
MRLLRVLAAAAGIAALVPHTSSAQDNRQFKDAWFWGVKTGAVSYASQSTTDGGAVLFGGDWMITRTNGGLYVSYDEAFLNTQGGYVDRDPDSTSAFIRPVQLHNLRRFTMAAMVFPYQTPTWHAYAGLGLQYNAVASAAAVGPFSTTLRAQIAIDSVQARKSSFSPVLVVGTQARLAPFSVFIQGTASPMQQTFFLSNPAGHAFNAALELGVRYNTGSSIDRQRP